jgi:membrane protein DedA with SNARE-associated domain
MPWWRFAIFNAAGGIVWATLVSVVAYQFGKSAADAIQHYGLYALAVIIVIVGVGVVLLRLVHRRGIDHA